jgi:hypothetical protein
VTDDLERRLRESLRAYADLVQAPDEGLPTAPARTSAARPNRRWRGMLLAAAAAAAVISGSLWLVDGRDSVPSAGSASDAQASAGLPQSDSRAAAGAASDSAEALSSLPEVGVGHPFDLPTHCGIRGAEVAGVWFAADPPLVAEGDRPPAGWADPFQPGTLTLVTADAAVFADAAGHEVRLHADEAARPALCE